MLNVDFTSDTPLDDTSGLAVSFVKPNDVTTPPVVTSPIMTSFAEPTQTATSNGQKRKSSSDTPLPVQMTPNPGVKADLETPAIVDEPQKIVPNSDEP